MKQLTIIGNIGRDAEIKTHNGSEYVTFSVAVNKSYKKANGEKVEETDWISCLTRQTSLAQYLKAGTQVLCQGDMKVSLYQTEKSREWRTDIKLNCDKIQLLGSKRDAEAPARPAGPAAHATPTQTPAQVAGAPVRQQAPVMAGPGQYAQPVAAGFENNGQGDDNDLPF